MIVVRHAVVIDGPVTQAGHLWADFTRARLAEPDLVRDEWLHEGGSSGRIGAGEVHFEAVSAARTRVTLTVRLELAPSDPRTGPEVEASYHRAVAHLERFHEFAVFRVESNG